MMRGRAVLVAVFAALLAIGLSACGQQGSSSSSSASSGQANASAPTNSSSGSAGQQSASNTNEPELVRTNAFATMKEVFDAPGESDAWNANEISFGFLFKDGSKYVLVRTVLPEGMYDQIEAAYNVDDMETITTLLDPLSVYDEYTIESPTEQQLEILRANLTIRQ